MDTLVDFKDDVQPPAKELDDFHKDDDEQSVVHHAVDDEDVPAADETAEDDEHNDHAPEAEDGAVENTSEETFESRRQSTASAISNAPSRRASSRTEALIHSAARDIIAQIGHGRERESLQSSSIPEDESYVCDSKRSSTMSSTGQSRARVSDTQSSRLSGGEEQAEATPDDAGDSSSHHENDDDEFSDHSPRSSMGSESDAEKRKMDDNVSQHTRSPRISDISQYDVEEDFAPTARGTPRPPFRSPSSVKAMQMSSPPPSVLGSPRSSRRSPLPTVSRLGSPSAQYSPKKTPPRFKRSTPPLVLLHATLLPLRWPWGDILDSAQAEEFSQAGKLLRKAWRQLQDRVGDTVLERGILLPHPQNDYEVLEERLLEALELPMKRRARILECGHYLGPANEAMLADDVDSENDEFYEGAKSPTDDLNRVHWCSTCRSDIQFESLGPGKIFRVKVYASNGLMKAGAWEACWKEMERVDIELEPVVEPAVQDELNHLAAEQDAAMDLQDDVEDDQHLEVDDPETSYLSPRQSQSRTLPSSPPGVNIHVNSGRRDRRIRDEERLREIYGQTPPTRQDFSTAVPSPSDFIAQETPPSPSVEAYERRQERRQVYKGASLPELLLEAGKILIRDRRNVMIGLLSLLIMTLAVRRGGPAQDPAAFQSVVAGREVPTVTVTDASNVYGTVQQESVTLETTMRVVETVTETATVKVTATETYAEVETEALQWPAEDSEEVDETLDFMEGDAADDIEGDAVDDIERSATDDIEGDGADEIVGSAADEIQEDGVDEIVGGATDDTEGVAADEIEIGHA